MKVTPGAAAALAAAAGAAAVAATWPVFSQFFDEPAHLATGLEWLERGRYTLEPLHPPVARVLSAVGPWLDGARGQGAEWVFAEGNRILWAQGTYPRTLALSRLGLLPFFLLLALVVWTWTRRVHGAAAALAAVLLLVSLPPVLAHAGIAATDMGHTATLVLALYCAVRWLESPTPLWSAAVGASVGLAGATKFSAGLYLPPILIALIVLRRFLRPATVPAASATSVWIRGSIIATAAGVVVLLACYRFQVAPFIAGLAMLKEHQALGHDAFLLGQTGDGGWWYFFPVTFAVKTPIPFLLLGTAGVVAAAKGARATRDWIILAAPVGAAVIMAVAMTSRVTIGLRHILPVYPLLAIAAGALAARLWNHGARRAVARGAVAALVGWQVVSTASAHPDYLPWFSALAGRHPERIVVSGDLDWGQDLYRLEDALRARGVRELAFAYYGSADPRRLLSASVRPLSPDERAGGWVAASEAVIKGVGFEPHRGFEWLDSITPAAYVGRTIRLYHFPDRAPVPRP